MNKTAHDLPTSPEQDQDFDTLIETYRNYLFKVISGFTKNPMDTEEYFQQISLKIYHALPTWQGANFKIWAARIAVNHCIDQQRVRQVTEVDLDEEMIHQQTPPANQSALTNSPEEIVLLKEMKKELTETIERLPAIYRDVIQLYYFSELSYAEIAQKLGTNQRTIETRIFRARKMIGEAWRNHAL